MLFEGCAGKDPLRDPDIWEQNCPICGNSIEVFSTDPEIVCDKCGFAARNEACQYTAQRPELKMRDELVIPQPKTNSET